MNGEEEISIESALGQCGVCEMWFLKGKFGFITDKSRTRESWARKRESWNEGREGERERGRGSSSVFQEVKGGSDCFSWNVRKDVFCPLCGDASFPVAVTIRVKCF